MKIKISLLIVLFSLFIVSSCSSLDNAESKNMPENNVEEYIPKYEEALPLKSYKENSELDELGFVPEKDAIESSKKQAKNSFIEEARDRDALSGYIKPYKKPSSKELDELFNTEIDLATRSSKQKQKLVLGEFSCFTRSNILMQNQIMTQSEEECHEVIKYKMLELREQGCASNTPETRKVYGNTAHICTENSEDIKYFIELYFHKKKQPFAYLVSNMVMLKKEFPTLVVIPHKTISQATCNSLLSMMSSQAICVPNNDD